MLSGGDTREGGNGRQEGRGWSIMIKVQHQYNATPQSWTAGFNLNATVSLHDWAFKTLINLPILQLACRIQITGTTTSKLPNAKWWSYWRATVSTRVRLWQLSCSSAAAKTGELLYSTAINYTHRYHVIQQYIVYTWCMYRPCTAVLKSATFEGDFPEKVPFFYPFPLEAPRGPYGVVTVSPMMRVELTYPYMARSHNNYITTH